MPIDASIPLQGLLINRNDENLKQAQYQRYQAQAAEDRQKVEDRKRLADLLPKAVGGDQAAMSQVAGIDTDLWSKLSKQQTDNLKSHQDRILTGAKIVRQFNPQDQASWDQARQAAHAAGVDISDVPAVFDPQYVHGLVTVADALEKSSSQPSSIQEYEYAKNQGFDGSYVDFQNQTGSPIVTDNGDGTKTIYPRSMLSGGGQPQRGGGGPQVGSVVGGYRFKGGNPNDRNSWEPVNGGPSQSGSGGFL